MGTRGLTVVIEGGKVRVAQYGQWDHYPAGQGLTCLKFLRDAPRVERLRQGVRWVKVLSDAEVSKRWVTVGSKGSFATMAQADEFKNKWPELSRDTGAEILQIIAGGPGVIGLQHALDFAGDGACEWAWVVDFDEMAFEAWSSYGSIPDLGSQRFAELIAPAEPAIHLVARFDLDDLPSTKVFYTECHDADEAGKVQDEETDAEHAAA